MTTLVISMPILCIRENHACPQKGAVVFPEVHSPLTYLTFKLCKLSAPVAGSAPHPSGPLACLCLTGTQELTSNEFLAEGRYGANEGHKARNMPSNDFEI